MTANPQMIDWAEGLALTSPLSSGWEANGFVVLSGQVPLTPGRGRTVNSDFGAQARQVLDNLAAALAVADLGLVDVIRCTCYLTSRENFKEFNAIYAERFAKPYPARTTLIVDLANPDYLVELDAIAVRH